MKAYQLFTVILVCCMVDQGLAWWGSSSSSSSKGASEESNEESSESGSSWWDSDSASKETAEENNEESSESGLWDEVKSWFDSSDSSSEETVDQTKEQTSGTDMKRVIEEFEGLSRKAYDAQPNNPNVDDITIGIGFNLNRPDARETFEKIVPGVDFDKVKAGKETITEITGSRSF